MPFLYLHFTRYKAISRAVREIFQGHPDAIEPLSLDEAYLDVTENKLDLPTGLSRKTSRPRDDATSLEESVFQNVARSMLLDRALKERAACTPIASFQFAALRLRLNE